MVYRIKEKKPYMDRDWLLKMYVEEELNEVEIGKICGVSRPTIHRWLERFEIPRRDLSEAMKLCHWCNVDPKKEREKINRIKTELALDEMENAFNGSR